jgi:hypothetical protein
MARRDRSNQLMATTTNFGWETPDDTDLVKDGALAMRTLGNSIDSSFVDLKGGTTGQVLSKASNTDLDFTWVAQDDSNAIQNAIVDAKGDLISATAADTPARLAVGTDGQILTADSSTSTGLKWATAASSSPASAVATVDTDQTTTSSTYTDLATSGPAVTLTTGTKVLVIVSAYVYQNTVSKNSYMDFAISGATSRSASDVTALTLRRGANDDVNFASSRVSRLTVTAGSNTFTAKYKTQSGGTAGFLNREICVIDLGS